MRHLRVPIVAVATVVLALLASACNGEDQIELEAVFEDVNELVPRHMVMTADVQVGTVTAIELTDDFKARVRMQVREDTGLPADVQAVVKKTQVLGEYYVDLIPVGDSGQLSSGVITDARVAGDLEDLVGAGQEFLAYLAADALSAAVHAGATTFGGRGETLGSFVSNLEVFVTRFGDRDADILRLIDGLDRLLVDITPEADTYAETLQALARSSEAFAQEDERLLDSLEDLQRLAVVSERIMREHRQEIDDFFRVFRKILDEVTRYDGAFANFLSYWPLHNLHVANGIVGEHAQLFADLVFCDTPGEDRDDPSRSCFPHNAGQSGRPHEDFGGLNPCDFRHEGCPYPEGVQPRTSRDGQMWQEEAPQ